MSSQYNDVNVVLIKFIPLFEFFIFFIDVGTFQINEY